MNIIKTWISLHKNLCVLALMVLVLGASSFMLTACEQKQEEQKQDEQKQENQIQEDREAQSQTESEQVKSKKEENSQPLLDPERSVLHIITQEGHTHIFHVEEARTPEEQAKGLMFRTHLDSDSGMLFFFEKSEQYSFWMRNTLIPLDMIFIREDGIIEHIHDNAIPHDETPIRAPNPVRAVLEINGGLSEKLGLNAGDRIEYPLFNLP